MSEIPEDVMVAARGVVEDYLNQIEAFVDSASVAQGQRDHWAEVQCAARAILAERERCARIADRHVNAHHTAIRDAILNP